MFLMYIGVVCRMFELQYCIDKPPIWQSPFISFFPIPKLLTTFFREYRPNEMMDKHKN